MNIRTLASAVLVLIVIAGGLIYFESGRIKAESISHSYRYSVILDPLGSIHNATIMVPVGVVNGYSPVADAIEHGAMSGVPDGWHLMLLTSNDSIYLKMTSPEMKGRNNPVPVPIQVKEGVEIPIDDGIIYPMKLETTLDSESEIDTRSPFGKEPLLEPKYNLTGIHCGFPHPEDMQVSCSRYTIPLYCSYTAEDNATLSIEVLMEGENTWWLGGWTGNSYSDRVNINFKGPQDGWNTAEGSFIYGLGRY